MSTPSQTLFRCDACRWWVRLQKTVLLGECKRMPPIFADNIEDPRVWPVTKRDDWCGEFSRPVDQDKL